ncbi:hypothetical protein NMY22_g10639 [Coprinellus aureogranulatus]|nr:hypothetical protein NMY22_g10639 [Coprinellus aureogranulatus]
MDLDPRLFSLLGTTAFLYLVSCAISRLYFHPLSQYPGPTLAALTGYYVTYFDIFQDAELIPQLQKLHDKYGPVVRIGPNKLHFSDPSAYDDIYRDNRFPKEPWFYDAFISYTSSFGCTDIKGASERRGLLNPFFSRRSILNLEHVIQGTIDRFMASMQKNCREANIVDIHKGFLSIGLEVITAYCFAQRFDAIEYPGYQYPFVGAVLGSYHATWLVQHFPFLKPLVFGLPEWIVKVVSPASLAFPTFTRRLEDQIDSILADPSSLERAEQETIYHHLVNPEIGQGLTGEALSHEANTLVAAGTVTVGDTSTVAVFHILSNRDIEKRLRRELQEAWPNVDAPMPVEKLEKLPYLTAVIQEALRLGYGVVSPMPRIATYTKAIGGHMVPQGTVVSMSHFFMHMNPNIFPEPKKFDPDRWLKDDAGELLKYLVPFSRGQRQCVGMNLGWVELYLVLGNFFRKVNLELVDTTEKDIEWKATFTVKFKGKVKARVNKVEGVHSDFA